MPSTARVCRRRGTLALAEGHPISWHLSRHPLQVAAPSWVRGPSTPVVEAIDDRLERARRDAGLTTSQLFWRYFELGGMATALQLEAFCYGALEPSAHDHDIVAHALNERFSELGRNHPVPYAEDQ